MCCHLGAIWQPKQIGAHDRQPLRRQERSKLRAGKINRGRIEVEQYEVNALPVGRQKRQQRITHFDASAFASQIAGEVKGFDPLRFIEKKDVKKMDVFIQFAIAAAQFAMDDSKLPITERNAPRVGVFMGSGIGGFTSIEREHIALLQIVD